MVNIEVWCKDTIFGRCVGGLSWKCRFVAVFFGAVCLQYA